MRIDFTEEELYEDMEASMRLQQEVEQAREILNRNGLCPIDTDCCECIVLKIRGGSSGCNPKTAIKACKEFLGDSINPPDDGQLATGRNPHSLYGDSGKLKEKRRWITLQNKIQLL